MKDYTDLLWTGGWDSTYRLLQLLFDGQADVQPWYLLDEERLSTTRELEAMVEIRHAVEELLPEARERLRPIRLVNVASVAANSHVTRMASRLRLGSQYDWLSRFAQEYALDGLELGVESRPGRVQAMLAPLLEERRSLGGNTYRVSPERLHAPGVNADLELFAIFSFPLIRMTKREMLREARARGWEPILTCTWFCHNPRGGRPCGSCDPCLIAVEEGFSFRIPALRRVPPRLRLWMRRLESWRAQIRPGGIADGPGEPHLDPA